MAVSVSVCVGNLLYLLQATDPNHLNVLDQIMLHVNVFQ